MSDAADLALKVEATTIPEQASQQFLEGYYCLLEPAGIAARHEENREFHEEWDDLEINWLGHIFVADRPCFLGGSEGFGINCFETCAGRQ